MSTDNSTKRVMALDLGKARVGVAVSDELGLLAHPRAPLEGRDQRKLLAQLVGLVRQLDVGHLLVGLPLALSGEASIGAKRAIRLCQKLADATGLNVELVDERLTTVQAERALRSGGASQERIKERVDGAAAAVMLQQWLDRERPREFDPTR